jgi:hypothetical protein
MRKYDRMHEEVRWIGYPSDSTRAMRQRTGHTLRGRQPAAPLPTPSTAPSPPPPGPAAVRPVPVPPLPSARLAVPAGCGGTSITSATAPGGSCSRGRCHPPRASTARGPAGLTVRLHPHRRAAGRALLASAFELSPGLLAGALGRRCASPLWSPASAWRP